MPFHEITFRQPISSKFVQDLEDMVYFVDEGISDFELLIDKGEVRGIRVDKDAGKKNDLDALAAKFELVNMDIMKRRDIPKRRVWEKPLNGRSTAICSKYCLIVGWFFKQERDKWPSAHR